MKGTDLLRQLTVAKNIKESYIDKEIRIVLEEPFIGSLSTVALNSFDITHGSDFDRDKILIFPEEALIRKFNNRDIPKEPLIFTYTYDKREIRAVKKCPICETKLASTDRYCKQCGQRIKINNTGGH